MVNGYITDIISDKIKKIIGIGKFDNTKILIDTDDKLPNDITLKNVAILITCVIKDDGNFIHKYSQKKPCLLNKYVKPFFIDEFAHFLIGVFFLKYKDLLSKI